MLNLKCISNLLCYLEVDTATVQQSVGFNAKISVEKCHWYRLQLYLRSDPWSFLLVAASVVLLRICCLLLGYSALIVTLLSVDVVLRVHLLRMKTTLVPVAPEWSAAVRSTSPVLFSTLLVVVWTRLLPLVFIIKFTSIAWLVLICLVSEDIVFWDLIPVPNWLCILLLLPCICPMERWVMEAIGSVHKAPCFCLAETLFHELLDSWGRDWTSSHNPVGHKLTFPSIRDNDQGCGFVSRVDMTHLVAPSRKSVHSGSLVPL